MSSRILTALGALALLAACGRSTLLTLGGSNRGTGASGAAGGAGPGGGGSAAGGDDTGGGGAGGAGGSPSCELGLSGPSDVAGAGEFFHLRQPALAFSRDDDARVTMAMEWLAVEGPAPLPSELRHTSFEPWGPWPSELGPSFLADFEGGRSFDVARSPQNRFALAYAVETAPGPPPPTVVYSPFMVPGSGDVGPGFPVTTGNRVAEVAALPDRHLILSGVAPPNAPAFLRFEIMTIEDDAVTPIASELLGCGSTPPRGDAIPTGDGWLVAMTTADCGTPNPGPPDAVRVVRIAADGTVSPPLVEIEVPAHHVHLVPGGAGAPMVVWGVVFDTFGGPLTAMRLPEQEPPPPEVQLVADALPTDFAVTPFGDGIAVAYQSTEEGLTVATFDDDHAPLSTLDIPEQGTVEGVDALSEPPSHERLVLAWSDVFPDSPAEIHVARVGCDE